MPGKRISRKGGKSVERLQPIALPTLESLAPVEEKQAQQPQQPPSPLQSQAKQPPSLPPTQLQAQRPPGQQPPLVPLPQSKQLPSTQMKQTQPTISSNAPAASTKPGAPTQQKPAVQLVQKPVPPPVPQQAVKPKEVEPQKEDFVALMKVFMERLYRSISSLYPKPVVERVRMLMLQAGYSELFPELYLGFTLFSSLSTGLFLFLASQKFVSPLLLNAGIGVGGFILVQALAFMKIFVDADAKASKIELVLPDALQMMSSNIRAGMTLENAIWISARPEFGPLRDEIKHVSAQTFAGKPVTESFYDMVHRVRSDLFERAIKLVVEGIRLGGEMANLLDEVAADIKSTQMLQRELVTSTMMYAIFIIFAAMIIAPALFAVSSFYSEMNEQTMEKAQKRGGQPPEEFMQKTKLGGFGMGIAKTPAISAEEVKLFSLVCIVITNFFAALNLGVIQKGKWVSGLKFAPVFVIVSVLIFIGARILLNQMLGGMFQSTTPFGGG